MVRPTYKQTEIGEIPEDWDVKAVEDVATVIRGASPRPKGDKRYYGGNIPRLMVEDVTRDGKYVTPSVDFLTEEGQKRSRPCEAGTLTVVCSGMVGVPSFLKVKACIHDGFLALVNVKKGILNDFIYHYLKTQQNRLDKSGTHGGVFTNLTTEIIREFKIPVPPILEEQKAISKALSDVDDLIVSLEKWIAKKRDIKTATMQQLLTGKKRLTGFGEGKGYKQTELGRIPEDWGVKALEDVKDSTDNWSFTGGPFGSNLKSSDYTEIGIRVIQLQNIGDGKFLDTYEIYTSEGKADELKSCNIFPGEIILSKMGDPVARACLIPEKENREGAPEIRTVW